MSDLNRFCVSGRIVTEPELRATKGGTSVTSFRFASNRAWKDESGELQQDPLFIDVEVYGRPAESLVQYKGKGAFLLMDGSLRLQQWEKDGQRHSRIVLVADRVFFGPANGKAAVDRPAPGQPGPASSAAPGASPDEDLPF